MPRGRTTTLQGANRRRGEVRYFVAKGWPHAAIAARLGIARATVTYYANVQKTPRWRGELNGTP